MREVTKQTRELLAQIAGNNKQLIRWLESIQQNSSELPGDIEEILASIAEIESSLSSVEESLIAIETQLVSMQFEIDQLEDEVSLINGVFFGEAEIDFGAWPGSNETSVVIPNVTASDDWKIKAYIMANDSTTDHTAIDHRYVGLFLNLTAYAVDDVGIMIYATSPDPLEGTFKVRYERVN